MAAIGNDSSFWNVGDTVLEVTPLVCATRNKCFPFRCDNCLAVASFGRRFMRCSSCSTICYCSKVCQKKAWKSHKYECKTLQLGEISEVCRILYKLVAIFLNNRKLTLADVSDSAGWKTLQDLPTHGDKVKHMEGIYDNFQQLLTHFRNVCTQHRLPYINKDLFWDLYCIARTYHDVFAVISKEKEFVKPITFKNYDCIAVVPSLTAFEYSCDATTCQFMCNGKLCVRMVAKVPRLSVNDYKGVTFMYDHPLRPVELRRVSFEMTAKNKVCQCERCVKEREGPYLIRCSVEGCLGICYLDKTTNECTVCDKCSSTAHPKAFDPDYLMKYRERLQEEFCGGTFQSDKEIRNLMSWERNPFHPLDLTNVTLQATLPAMLVSQIGCGMFFSLNPHSLLRKPLDRENCALAKKILLDIIIPAYNRYAPNAFLQIGEIYLYLYKSIDKSCIDERRQAVKLAYENLSHVLDADSNPVMFTRELLSKLDAGDKDGIDFLS